MKVKGFFKGMKHISHIFVYKEQEMQIGSPTDVKHIAHIGWDSSSVHNPSWMNEFNSGYIVPSMSLSSTSFGDVGQSMRHYQASGDFDQQGGVQPLTDATATHACFSDIQKTSKNKKRKKNIKISSPPTTSRSSSKSSRSLDSFATALEEADDTYTQ